MSQKQLKDKVIVITGGSQGLGRAVARKASALGAVIVLVARREKFLKETQKKIATFGGRVDYFTCDIRHLSQVKETVRNIQKRYKQIDVLVNNAGVWSDEELEKRKPELRNQVFETNILGHIQFTKECLPIFRKQNSGYIFNVISTSGASETQSGNNSLWQTYGASKWAMRGFTKDLRHLLTGTKIKVTGFFPGGFESNLYENAGRPNPHHQPWMMKTDDIADIVIFALTRPEDMVIETLVVTKRM